MKHSLSVSPSFLELVTNLSSGVIGSIEYPAVQTITPPLFLVTTLGFH